MGWIKFDKSEQVDRFMSAIERLHQPLLGQITPEERAWFSHFWLHRLNLSECFLWDENGRSLALITFPRVRNIHWHRWQTSTLMVDPDFELPELPYPVLKSTSFDFPIIADHGSVPARIRGHRTAFTQYCTALRIENHSPDLLSVPEIEFRWIETTEDVQNVEPVFQARIDEFGRDDFYNSYYLPVARRNIERAPESGQAWAAYAVDKATGNAVALASYVAWELPLGGPQAALVEDVYVSPRFRRQNIATAMQAYAYAKLQSKGIRWVCGNIEPDNTPSLRQSSKLGRKTWSAVLAVEPISST